MGRKCRHDLRTKRQWSEWKANGVSDNKRCKYNLLCLYIDVLRPLTNDLLVFLFQTIDAQYLKWASPARTYVYVKAFIVNRKNAWNPFFLEQHINIVNSVTLQSVWFICSCLSYTQRKESSNNHLHTLSTKLIIGRFWPLKDQKLEVYLVVHHMETRIKPSTSYMYPCTSIARAIENFYNLIYLSHAYR